MKKGNLFASLSLLLPVVAFMLVSAYGVAATQTPDRQAYDVRQLSRVDSIMADSAFADSAALADSALLVAQRDSALEADRRRRISEMGTKITPVASDDQAPLKPTLHYYDKHGNPLQEPVLFLAQLDTVKKVRSGPVYPLLNSVSVGANLFDAVMLAFGQKHASFDLWADLSLHNWFFPVVEVGMGWADNHPLDANYHYKSRPALYGKIGINYNFLYKSDPAYQFYLGLRAGFSHFSYDITGVTVNSPYWQESQTIDILNQKASVFYGEALAGLKVKLFRNLSMGWNVRVHFKMHSSQPSNSNPWFIPGYGTSGLIGASFSLIYTLPLGHKAQTAEDTETK